MSEFVTNAPRTGPISFLSNDAHNLMVGGNFADALAGEFQPRCDPEFRMHTLGRLAITVFSAGAKEWPRGLRRAGRAQRVACYYPFPWAQPILGRAIATTHGPILHMNAVRLEAPTGQFLEISDQTRLAVPQIVIESSDVPLESHEVFTTEPGLIRERVASAAQQFFNDHA